jgi:cytochrome c oxidase subunit 2
MKEFLARWMPLDASTHGAQLDSMNALVHWLMAVLFIGWGLYFIYVLFRFRSGRNPEASYEGSKSHFSTWIEVGVVLVEAIILIGFAIPAWARWVAPHAEEASPLEIRVVGEQFAWNIHYPGTDGVFGRRDPYRVAGGTNPLGLDSEDPASHDDIVSVNQLHLPVNRPITVLLSTKDVIHSFFLPVMRVKQDAIPGQEIPVRFTAKMATPPELSFPACAAEKTCWEIACSQLCGLGHYRMRGFLTVHEDGGFEDWLAAQDPFVAPPEPEPEPEPEAVEPAA